MQPALNLKIAILLSFELEKKVLLAEIAHNWMLRIN
jgi:hypothetical protein